MTDNRLGIIDFPFLVQSLANQARGGVLEVSRNQGSLTWRFLFRAGAICGSHANDGWGLYHALRWVGQMQVATFVAAGVPDPNAFDDLALAQRLISANTVSQDGLRDAVDCLIEERFTAVLGHGDLALTFQDGDPGDPWLHYQAELGTSILGNTLLMEGLRVQDELGRTAGVTWDPDELLMTARGNNVLEDDSRESRLLQSWREREPIRHNLLAPGIPPSQARLALCSLLAQQLLRPASMAELVILAEQLEADGLEREQEHVLRRAVAKGSRAARVLLKLAYLAEHRRDLKQAALDNLHGGLSLVHQNPRIAIKALTKARELGAERVPVLEGLLACYQALGDHAGACTALLQLAESHERNGDRDAAIQAVQEAQQLGADTVACALTLARLHGADDPHQALVHLQSAAHLAVQHKRLDAAALAWEKLLQLQPGNVEIALLLVRHQLQQQQQEAALKTVKSCLAQVQDEERADEHLIALCEIHAKLVPRDPEVHQRLAQLYQKRKDVDSAAQQLLHVAQAQEHNEQWSGLAHTLSRVLDLDGERFAIRVHLARTLFRLGQTPESEAAWNQAAQSALAQGRLGEAREIAREGLQQHPGSADLHLQAAALATREGSAQEAGMHLQMAAYLALGTDQPLLARTILAQLTGHRPEDLLARQQLCIVALQTNDPHAAAYLRGLVRLAIRGNNLGIAVDAAIQWVLVSPHPAFAAREELVELLRRAERHQEELDEGRSLFQDLIEAGEYERALALQQRLVASAPEQPELVVNLAEVFEALEQQKQAERCYRHAASLYQQAGDQGAAQEVLQRLLSLVGAAPDINRALELARHGQAIHWESIQDELAAAKKAELLEKGSPGDTDRSKTRLRTIGSGLRTPLPK